jgi:DNA-directed RNA polymerase specialized sigma24 family protein
VDNLIRLLPKDSWKQIARMKADGISEKLISQKLGVTVLSVRSAWGRALRFLRKFLAEKAQAA